MALMEINSKSKRHETKEQKKNADGFLYYCIALDYIASTTHAGALDGHGEVASCVLGVELEHFWACASPS